MRRSGLVALALFIAIAGCAPKGEQSSPAAATTERSAAPAAPQTSASAAPTATFPSLGGNGSGYLAAPTETGKKPAVIVVQEWWGVNDWVRQQADRFASQGYVALAVDLYRGRTATTMEEAHELSRALPEDRAMADLEAAYTYLASREDVDPERIGVVGWCLGGGYALALATAEPRLKATAVNYGRLVTDPATISRIQSPILGNFGAMDRGIPPEDVKKFDAALKSAGKNADIKVYDGAGHAFMNPNNKEGYNASAAADAQARIDRFFAQNLRANIPNS